MVNEYLLSIIMTTYNEANNVSETVNAVLSQTYKKFELLIADDGSSDDTVEIIKSFNDNRIKLFETDHSGRASTLNFVLKKAKGNFIAINDADDIPAKDKFTKQIEYLEKHPDIYMLGSQGYIYYLESEKKVVFNKPLKYEKIKKQLLFENTFIHSSVLFRKEIFEKVGYYNEKFTAFGIEYELWSRIIPLYKVENLPDRLITYKVHKTNTFRVRNPFIKFKHQIIMRYLIFKRLKYPIYTLILVFYLPILYIIKDISRNIKGTLLDKLTKYF